jgi:hypothetical protein
VDRYQRIGAHGEMISSDLHGAEEPIRWLLGWQRQDRVVTSPCMEKKKDALIRTLWQRLTYGGSAPAGGMMALMDRTPPEQTGRFLEDVAVCLDLVARVAACRRPRGANVLLLDADHAQKGPTSPSEGPDVSHFSSILTFLAF